MNYTGDYFIGLDIGTDSVGWAVTDPDYHVLKANQKALWGVRLFDSAETAAKRRSFRIGRRRLERRKQRIQWLQMLFDEEISRVDPAFFQRMKESKWIEEDKQGVSGPYALFSDEKFTDVEYYKKYPTIYHLRYALLTEDGPFDVRLVYLALHHIIKNRGHFLLNTEVVGEGATFSDASDALRAYLLEEYGIEFTPNTELFETHLKDRNITKTKKATALRKDAGLQKKDAMLWEMMNLLAGGKSKLAILFQDENLKNADPDSVELGGEVNEEKLSAVLGDRLELLLKIKALYDWAVLDDILGGHQYLSEAKVNCYQKHRDDLALLKKEVIAAIPAKYTEIFHKERDKLNNYVAYIGNGKFHCKDEDFRKYLTKHLKAIQNPSEGVQRILTELEQGSFLPKQVVKENSVIPHQVHRREIQDILTKAEGYLPFLRARDADGISVSEKILSIFDYHIPYYVGPLNPNSPYSWVERTAEPIYPWNFDRVVNSEASAEKFILRMTSKCTYIKEDVLPKDSLLYSEFMALNALNTLCINGKRVSPEVKQKIYHGLFLKSKTINYKALNRYLLKNGICQETDVLSGLDSEFKANMKAYSDFQSILERTGDTEMVEDIIRRIVLFGEDRKLLHAYVEKTYGHVLSKEDIRYVCGKQYSGWGKLSREFLTELYHVDPDTGEAMSIIEMLRRTNCNLMELLSGKYTFRDAVKAWNEEHHSAGTQSVKDMVDETYASPAVKRAILQAIAIVDELVKIMGKRPPKRIFVEMARGPEEKKRTVSRKNELINLYKSCQKEAPELCSSLETLSEDKLRQDRLYLYYTQMGRCMYSGEPITLSSLFAKDYCDIDHIFPRSKVKDDSLDNRVLVKKNLNQGKENKYPIAQEIRTEMRPFWESLKKRGFISAKKYDRLIRSTTFAEEELAGFINRQLVETRQSSKIVADILEKRCGDATEVVYVKAGNVSEFRQKADRDITGQMLSYDFVKCREVNDLHHAKDAYLNIVVGNVYHVKFTKNPLQYIRSREGENYTLNHLFQHKVERNGEIAWLPGPDGSMATVRKTMRKNNVLTTRKLYEKGGELYDQKIVPQGKGQIPIKSKGNRMPREQYGGYNKLAGTYYCLVEHGKEGKRKRSLEDIMLMDEPKYRADPEAYCRESLKLIDPRILIKEIRRDSLLSYHGFKLNLSGRTNDRITCKNFCQLILEPEMNFYVKAVGKWLKENEAVQGGILPGRVTQSQNVALYDKLVEKLQNRVYGIKYAGVAEKLGSNKAQFTQLDLKKQCEVLLMMLRLFSNSNASGANLKLLSMSTATGRLEISKNLSKEGAETVTWINQSVTGVFEQEIDLLGDFPASPRR